MESETAMIESKRLAYSSRKMSDAVLDGLFAGVAASLAMAVYLVVWGLTAGLSPGAVGGMFDPSERGAAGGRLAAGLDSRGTLCASTCHL